MQKTIELEKSVEITAKVNLEIALQGYTIPDQDFVEDVLRELETQVEEWVSCGSPLDSNYIAYLRDNVEFTDDSDDYITLSVEADSYRDSGYIHINRYRAVEDEEDSS